MKLLLILLLVGEKIGNASTSGKTDIEWYYRGIAAALPELTGYKMYQEINFLLGEVFK